MRWPSIRRTLVRACSRLVLGACAAAAVASAPSGAGPRSDRVVVFAADGMRQDLVERWSAEKRSLPTLKTLLRRGAGAAGGGLLVQAPTDSGAGAYTLATGAWPAVTGATQDTFHGVGRSFIDRTRALDPGSLSAETLAQAAERGGRKVAQVEWKGARAATIAGPTVEGQIVLSGRGVATNYVGPDDAPGSVAALGLQFDHPAGFAGQPPFAAAAPASATGWSDVPPSFSPPMEMRLRVLDGGSDAYGVHAYLFDGTDDGVTGYDRVLLTATKSGLDAVELGEGDWAEIRVAVQGGALDGLTAGYRVKVEKLAPDLSQVRLYHTAVSRADARWESWPGEPGFAGDFAEYAARTFPVASAADAAPLAAGIVSEETFVEQALSWDDAYRPLIDYVLRVYEPDLLLAGYPPIDAVSRELLGALTERLPNGADNPAYDDADLDGVLDARIEERTGLLRRAYRGADETLARIQKRMRHKPTTFVVSAHGLAPAFLAVDASRVLVDLGLLSTPQISNCRPSPGETIGKAKACWSGGTVQIYLNLAGRDPAGEGFQQVAALDEAATVSAIRAAYESLSDPNDWTGDGVPEGWPVVDATFTRAEARAVPNGGGTADLAHPTRSGDLVVLAAPPYQFEAPTPGTLIAASRASGQHGYAPDLEAVDAGASLRGIFLAGGRGIARTTVTGLRAIDLAPLVAYLMRIPLPQHAQGVVRLEALRGGRKLRRIPILAITDFHGQLQPTTFAVDGQSVPVGGAAELATLFDEEEAQWPEPALRLASGDNVGASPTISSLLEDLPAIAVENALGLDASALGNHEFDYGLPRLLAQQSLAEFPFLAANLVETASGAHPDWALPSRVFEIGKASVGVIGIALESTPELVRPGFTSGLTFLPAADAIRTESERLRRMGVKAQVVLVHDGFTGGSAAVGTSPALPWQGPVVEIVQEIQDTTVDLVLAGHTHRGANVTIGRIPVLESPSGGAGYSAVELLLAGRDVEWVGGASRVARNLGVSAHADVQAIVADAAAASAGLTGRVVGTQSFDVLRAPTRLFESAMGNLVTDAMRSRYPGVDAALLNSGTLRADLRCDPPSAGEASCEITWGEVFAVLPFGNRTVVETLTGAQLEAALVNGFTPFCDPGVPTGRFPQVSGLLVAFSCNGLIPVVSELYLAPPGSLLVPIGPADAVRIATTDFMLAGGDGYAVLGAGSDVTEPGELLIDVTTDHIAAGSPVDPVVEGRILGP